MSVGYGAEIDRRAFLKTAGSAAAALSGAAALADPLVSAARPRASTGWSPGGLQAAMRGHVFRPGDPGFLSVAHVYNERFDGVIPAAVARPVNTADVRAALKYLIPRNVPFRARSGGHSYEGYSTLKGGAVLELSKLTGISVDKRAGTATVGAGCQLIDVLNGLAAHGATIPTGSCPSVGIAGVTLGGGMGLAGRAFGMTADNLVGATIVTADGSIRTVNRTSNSDLFWALRGGGGGNFGIVTNFTYKVHPLPGSAAFFFVNWPWSQAAAALGAWLNWAPHARDQVTSIFHLNAGDGNSVEVTGQFLGPASSLNGLLAPLRGIPGARVSSGNMAYMPLQLLWAGCEAKSLAACHTVGAGPGGTLPRESFQAKSDYVSKPLPLRARNLLVSALEQRAEQPGSGAILFDSYGGAINRVSPTATAFVHRRELACMQYLSYNGGGGWLANIHAAMRPYVSGSAYQNYIDISEPNWAQAYYGQNLSRLKSIRQTIDPDHHFNFPQAIGR